MDLRSLPFGIEIETVGKDRRAVAQAIQSVVGGLMVGDYLEAPKVQAADGRTWSVMRDGSLPNGGAEVVSPILRYEDIDTLQKVLRAIRRCGAKVNEKCGIHIHVDASGLDGRGLANLTRIVYKQEPLILEALGISPARLSRYTKPIEQALVHRIDAARPTTREQMSGLWYGMHNPHPTRYDLTRYHGLNLHSVWYRGTVEFRWFESTLHAGKVKAYIQLCLALVAKAMAAKTARSERRTLDHASARYDFRVFLLRLGFIGEEFKTARHHLLERMGGDGAFKRGRAARQAAAPTQTTETAPTAT